MRQIEVLIYNCENLQFRRHEFDFIEKQVIN